MAGGQPVSAFGQVGLQLHHIDVRFLSHLLLLFHQTQGSLGRGHLLSQHFLQFGIIQHIAISLYRGQTQLVLQLLGLRQTHLLSGLGDFNIVNRLKAIEQHNSSRNTIAIMKRGDRTIGIGFGVDRTAKVGVCVCASADGGRKSGQDGISAVNLCIPIVSLPDFHLGRMTESIANTGLQIHDNRVLSL